VGARRHGAAMFEVQARRFQIHGEFGLARGKRHDGKQEDHCA
jgi:hypothetical protein